MSPNFAPCFGVAGHSLPALFMCERESAGDLMMVSVLLRLKLSGILDEFPNLAAYVPRGEARSAYKRAFAAQWAMNAGMPLAG